MNTNSFHLKEWSIAVYAALLALYAGSGGNKVFLFIAVAPAMMFWFLDAYYLQQERKFRGIYNDVAGLTNESERIEIRAFEMPIQKYEGGKYSYSSVFWSQTICPLYIFMIMLAVSGGILL